MSKTICLEVFVITENKDFTFEEMAKLIIEALHDNEREIVIAPITPSPEREGKYNKEDIKKAINYGINVEAGVIKRDYKIPIEEQFLSTSSKTSTSPSQVRRLK